MQTNRITPSRKASTRADYSEEAIHAIVDEALFCTVSYSQGDVPFSIPQSHVRIGNQLYIHGSVGSHFINTIADGRAVCISIMLADELVLAKSAFHHSVNYRSIVCFSKGALIEDENTKYQVLRALTEKMVPNSWEYLRPMTAKEVAKTHVVAFDLTEASVKSRSGWPSQEASEDHLPIWTGLIPIKPIRQTPIPDPASAQIELPEHLK